MEFKKQPIHKVEEEIVEEEKIIAFEPINEPVIPKQDVGSIVDEKFKLKTISNKTMNTMASEKPVEQIKTVQDTKPSEQHDSMYEAFKQSHAGDTKPKGKPEQTIVKKKIQMPDKKDMAQVIVKESKQGINWTRAGLYLCALGMVGIIFFSQMANDINPVFVILIWLFGMMCFLPLGFIGGWLFLDPYMRCKLYRRFRGRNYGIVNFLHKGGQRIVTRIKNLDDDVIVEGGKMWLLDKEGIHYLDKNNEKQLWKKIDVEHIKTLPANVPCLFLDPETMTPIKFVDQPSKTNPQQAGAIVLGYINNQIQKNAMFKKNATIFYIIIIAVTVVNLVIALQTYTWLEEMHEMLPAIKHGLNQLIAQQTPPVP